MHQIELGIPCLRRHFLQQHSIAIIFMDRYVGVFIDKQKIRMGKQNIKHKYASLCDVIILKTLSA
ncbi:Uncharacterised protein [Vibrio cholerae]|nr:Uncharacterised protein [Vibrio cholerae]CSC65863.1 Uncharacterised protein [Vibrio cholerae]